MSGPNVGNKRKEETRFVASCGVRYGLSIRPADRLRLSKRVSQVFKRNFSTFRANTTTIVLQSQSQKLAKQILPASASLVWLTERPRFFVSAKSKIVSASFFRGHAPQKQIFPMHLKSPSTKLLRPILQPSREFRSRVVHSLRS
jgi:hypothetical protein